MDWAGIRVTMDKCRLLESHVEAIHNFPVTDMRSFMALVNQVAPYNAVQSHLQPFRDLLKKGSIWYWDKNLTNLLTAAKEHISVNIVKGITRFSLGRWTALLSDWSKAGLEFIMTQKYCDCESITPICCSDG